MRYTTSTCGFAIALNDESRNARAASMVCVSSTLDAMNGAMKMTVAEFETLAEQDAADVMEWRFSQLSRSGFPAEGAIGLATRFDFDLHQAVDLVARGCPPSSALRILL